MARRLEERLAEVRRFGDAPGTPAAAAGLREALRTRSGLLVAAAAAIVGEHGLVGLAGELAPAFERLLDRAVERDPGCRGKVAVARALHQLDRWEDGVFTRGVTHVQREPVWGGSADTAAELRGVCGLAYAHFGRDDALDILAALLADAERAARAAAAQGLGDAGRRDAVPLLRFKALIGDDDSEVMVATLSSLLHLDAERGLPFVTRVLDGGGDAAAAAALALGQSRSEAALPVLLRWCEEGPLEVRTRVGYLALALLRAEPAFARLLDIVRTGSAADARAAVAALATYRGDERLGARVLAAAVDRRDDALLAAARAAFG